MSEQSKLKAEVESLKQKLDRTSPPLPHVRLSVSGDVFRAGSSMPVPWEIYAEAESPNAARTRITLDGRVMADVTIHANEIPLPEEVQEVSAAILWSAIRSWWWREGYEKTSALVGPGEGASE